MTRVELMQMAKECGWRPPEHGKHAVKTPQKVLAAIEQRLRVYFKSDAGKVVLARAPRHLVVTDQPMGKHGGGLGEEMRGIRTNEDVAIERLMAEFRMMGGGGPG